LKGQEKEEFLISPPRGEKKSQKIFLIIFSTMLMKQQLSEKE
jgi:hypothetical protein